MKLDKTTFGNIPFLTDGGLETELIFHHGIDLPHFAAFPLLDKPKYHELIKAYYRSYLEIARKNGTGYILESPTWRASKDWGYKLGYSEEDLDDVNTVAINKLKELQASYKGSIDQIYISGCVGPRGDGYTADEAMTANEAAQYHHDQIASFSRSKVDLVTAMTMNYSNEALGVVKAAMHNNCPVVISFTVETDGNLPNGESLKEAINTIDKITDS